jgi:hypothetical protein
MPSRNRPDGALPRLPVSSFLVRVGGEEIGVERVSAPTLSRDAVSSPGASTGSGVTGGETRAVSPPAGSGAVRGVSPRESLAASVTIPGSAAPLPAPPVSIPAPTVPLPAGPPDPPLPTVTLRRAVDRSRLFFEWRSAVHAGKRDARDVELILLSGPGGEPVHRWILHDALPLRWSGPALDALSGALATEELEITYSRITWSQAS